MRLAALQQLFREALTAPDPDGAAVACASAEVNGSPGLPAAEHVRIYRDAVLGTLTRALGEIYPVCRRLTGAAFFDAMAGRFIRQTPSRSPDLGDYGESFGAFITGFPPAAGLPYLPDVACLEWFWQRAFHAPDEAPLDVTAVAGIPEAEQGDILFRLPVSAALLASAYPIHRIWQVNQPEWAGDLAVNLDEGAVRLIVWRRGYEMRIDPLTDGQWWLLGEIAAGRTLGQMAFQPQSQDLAGLLPDCAARGWIAGFRLTPAR